MRGRSSVAVALGVGLLLLLLGSASALEAQSAGRRVVDTGVISLGPGQFLRVTVASASGDDVRVRFHRLQYSAGPCSSQDVCALSLASRVTSAPVTLAPGEAFYVDIGTTEQARVLVFGDSRVRVTAHVVDAATRQIIVVCIA